MINRIGILAISLLFVSAALSSSAFSLIMAPISYSQRAIDPIAVGMGPFGVAFDPANGNMYVTNYLSNTVSVIHGTALVTTIAVGRGPTGVAFNPVNRAMYVANRLDNTVSVIDSVSNTVAFTIGVGAPWGVTFDPSTSNMLVTGLGTYGVIDSTTNMFRGGLPGGCCDLRGVAFDPVHDQIYDAVADCNCVSVINGTTYAGIASFTVGVAPIYVAFDAVNGNMYVTNHGSGTISVINTKSNTVSATLVVGPGPAGIAFNPRNGDAYVAFDGSNVVYVIDGSTNVVLAVLTVGTGPQGVAFNPTKKDFYIAVYGLNDVARIHGLKVGH